MNDIVPKSKQLTLPGFKASPVGLVANKSLSQQQWEDAGHMLSHLERRLNWFIGDWLCSVREKWEQGSLEDICGRFDLNYGTAANNAMVSRAIAFSRRRENLSFGHHQEVSNRDDADELLDWCEETGASIKDLREEKKRRAKVERLEMADSLPDGQYSVIYADPPWQYTSGDQHTTESQETVLGTHYPSMPLDEICELPIDDMAAENSVLFLWVTSPLADEAFEVVTSWGFEYKSSFVWDKVKHNVGNYNSMRHEFLYVCTKGTCPPQNVKLYDSVQVIERTKHSEKPEEFRNIIETLYPKGRKLELFARKKTKGWKAWGMNLLSPTDIQGGTFEKYVAHQLGLKLIDDKKWQCRYGDTACKMEIKFDRRMHETGNVYVEGAESRQPDGHKVLSGPFKECKVFATGDCSKLLLFDPAFLRDMLHRASERNNPAVLKKTPTSIAMIMPYEYMKWIAYKEYLWDEPPLVCEEIYK